MSLTTVVTPVISQVMTPAAAALVIAIGAAGGVGGTSSSNILPSSELIQRVGSARVNGASDDHVHRVVKKRRSKKEPFDRHAIIQSLRPRVTLSHDEVAGYVTRFVFPHFKHPSIVPVGESDFRVVRASFYGPLYDPLVGGPRRRGSIGLHQPHSVLRRGCAVRSLRG